MIIFDYADNKKYGTLKFEGRLTIENIEELKNSFISSFDKTDHIILDHSKAEEFDFAYLQLLLAVLKTSHRRNKKFSIVKENAGSFMELCAKAGFGNSDETKFFIEENKGN